MLSQFYNFVSLNYNYFILELGTEKQFFSFLSYICLVRNANKSYYHILHLFPPLKNSPPQIKLTISGCFKFRTLSHNQFNKEIVIEFLENLTKRYFQEPNMISGYFRDDNHKKMFLNGHCPSSSDHPPSPKRARWFFFRPPKTTF